MSKYVVYYLPGHYPINTNWLVWQTWENAEDSRFAEFFAELSERNQDIAFKYEKVEPTVHYRIMAKPRYNGTVDWFPIYRHRIYNNRDEARAVLFNTLVKGNDALDFKVDEEETYD